MVEDYDQVTELASYLIKVDVFKGFVDYGFDLGTRRRIPPWLGGETEPPWFAIQRR